jgi:hypothetical protein
MPKVYGYPLGSPATVKRVFKLARNTLKAAMNKTKKRINRHNIIKKSPKKLTPKKLTPKKKHNNSGIHKKSEWNNNSNNNNLE